MPIRSHCHDYGVGLRPILRDQWRNVKLAAIPFTRQERVVLDHCAFEHGHVRLTAFDSRPEIISAFCAFAFDCAIAAAAGPLERRRNRPNSLSQSDDQSRGLHNAGGRTISCSLSTYLIGRRCCIAGRLQVVLLNAAFVGF